jgi:hypothetical protein
VNTYDSPTITDFEDVVRQMLQAEDRLRPAIGTDAVLRRRLKLVNGMHHAIDRVIAECRAGDEKGNISTATVPAQRTSSSTGRLVPTGGVR